MCHFLELEVIPANLNYICASVVHLNFNVFPGFFPQALLQLVSDLIHMDGEAAPVILYDWDTEN